MSRKTRRIFAIVLLIAFGAWLLFTFLPMGAGSSKAGPNAVNTAEEYEPTFRKEGELVLLEPGGTDTIKELDIELAETPEEISYGMMYRKSMDPNTGMLFLMGDEAPRSFYMKNTFVPLDIIYINDEGKVVSIQKNAKPLDETSLPSGAPASLVLEVTAGFSDRYGITEGTEVRYTRD